MTRLEQRSAREQPLCCRLRSDVHALGASAAGMNSVNVNPLTSLWNRAAIYAASAFTWRLSAAFVYLVMVVFFLSFKGKFGWKRAEKTWNLLTLSCTSCRLFPSFPKVARTSLRSKHIYSTKKYRSCHTCVLSVFSLVFLPRLASF